MQECWQRVKAAALAELQSGWRAGVVVEVAGSDGPLDRARFLALRYEFTQDWQPRGAIERSLVDKLAQA